MKLTKISNAAAATMKFPKFTNMMSFPLIRIIRVAQGVFALTVLGLSGFMARWYNTSMPRSSPAQINFLMFAAIWSLLSLIKIEVLPRFCPRVNKTYITASADITTTLLYLGAFLAMAVFMKNLLFCNSDVCRVAQADVAFSGFSFAVWAASAVLTLLDLVKERRVIRRGGGIQKEVV